jgi:hypothetical protein
MTHAMMVVKKDFYLKNKSFWYKVKIGWYDFQNRLGRFNNQMRWDSDFRKYEECSSFKGQCRSEAE